MFWRFRAQAARISTQTRKRTHKPIAVLGAIDHRPSVPRSGHADGRAGLHVGHLGWSISSRRDCSERGLSAQASWRICSIEKRDSGGWSALSEELRGGVIGRRRPPLGGCVPRANVADHLESTCALNLKRDGLPNTGTGWALVRMAELTTFAHKSDVPLQVSQMLITQSGL